jgi:hypothetical protein
MARLPRQLKEHLELAGVPTPLERSGADSMRHRRSGKQERRLFEGFRVG